MIALSFHWSSGNCLVNVLKFKSNVNQLKLVWLSLNLSQITGYNVLHRKIWNFNKKLWSCSNIQIQIYIKNSMNVQVAWPACFYNIPSCSHEPSVSISSSDLYPSGSSRCVLSVALYLLQLLLIRRQSFGVNLCTHIISEKFI